MPRTAEQHVDPSHNIWRHGRQSLDAIFDPHTIAVIGATERPASVGRTLLENLTAKPSQRILFPVNPLRETVLGMKSFRRISDIPEPVDLAVIVTPAETVPALVGECVHAKVGGVIIISAGFRECGPEGAELEQEILQEIKGSSLRLIGPNCLGAMMPYSGLNATFAHKMVEPGKVAFISQSGALGTAILDWSFEKFVGLSAFVSIGSMLDVGWGDLIDYFGNDPYTQSIVIYMESIGNARMFLSAAREVSLRKPIIVIKAGRTEAASKAAASHTGALTGSDEVLDAAFRRTGVLRVDQIEELFYMADILAKQPRPRGSRLSIITNAGGPGVLAADALISSGGELASLSEESKKRLNALLPAHWSHANPVDILGDAEPDRFAKALEIVSQDPGSDGMLLILTPQAMTNPTQTAEKLKPYARLDEKPVIACWMGGSDVEEGRKILDREEIPVFEYPDLAARLFHHMWQYSYNLKSLYETPTLPFFDAEERVPNRTLVKEMIRKAGQAGRVLLTEFESKNILAAYGIPTVETRVAKTSEEACKLADQIGYPVVLKLHSETLTHKTDVGGVKLNLTKASGVEEAFDSIKSSVSKKAGSEHFLGVTVQPFIPKEGYELILGMSVDSQFGPVILFGTGGELVEVFQDRALGLPPLNTTLARRMMERTRIFKALKGVRGREAVRLDLLEQILVLFSHLVVEQPWIKEIDINPLLVHSERIIALDARILLHDPGMKEEDLPKPVIRPYPAQYQTAWTLKDGTPVLIRPIRPEDEPLVVDFHRALSDRTVHMRFFQQIKLSERIAHERLLRRCFNDYDREIGLVADHRDSSTQAHKIIAIARLSKHRYLDEAELAIVVSDQYQGRGLGTELFKQLIEVARAEKIKRLKAAILPDNHEMQHICQKLGFQTVRIAGESTVRAELVL